MQTYGSGYEVIYDAIGNPIRMGDLYNFDYPNEVNMTWEGRELKSYAVTEAGAGGAITNTVTFEYNADGIRTRKTGYGYTHEYMLNGNQIVSETFGEHTLVYSILATIWFWAIQFIIFYVLLK